MSLVQGDLDGGDSPEQKKDQPPNKVIGNQGDTCAEQRQGDEQSNIARLGVHSRSRLERGSDQAAPSSSARVDGLEPYETLSAPSGTAGHLSGSDRATRCPIGNEPRRGADASRPRPLRGVN